MKKWKEKEISRLVSIDQPMDNLKKMYFSADRQVLDQHDE